MRRWTIEVALPAISDTQQEIAEHLEVLGVEGRASFVINMVYEEVARNLVDHAVGSELATFDVHLDHADDATTIVIEDEFAPFDPTHAHPQTVAGVILQGLGDGLR
ncbi:MAG: ATP-binding protein, partial [Actinomycetota bacterium]